MRHLKKKREKKSATIAIKQPSQRTRQIMRKWEPWTTNIGKSNKTTECFNSWLFINSRPSKLPWFKTLTLGLALTMPMSPYLHTRCQISNPVKSLPELSFGHLWLTYIGKNGSGIRRKKMAVFFGLDDLDGPGLGQTTLLTSLVWERGGEVSVGFSGLFGAFWSG